MRDLLRATSSNRHHLLHQPPDPEQPVPGVAAVFLHSSIPVACQAPHWLEWSTWLGAAHRARMFGCSKALAVRGSRVGGMSRMDDTRLPLRRYGGDSGDGFRTLVPVGGGVRGRGKEGFDGNPGREREVCGCGRGCDEWHEVLLLGAVNCMGLCLGGRSAHKVMIS